MINDRTGGGKLHAEAGVVLVIDNPALLLPDCLAPGQQVAQLVNAIGIDGAAGNGVQQLDLIVAFDARPVVDDDVGCPCYGRLVDLEARCRDIGVGDRNRHLPVFEQGTVEHRPGAVGRAAHDIRARNDRLQPLDRYDLDTRQIDMGMEGLAVRGGRAEHPDAADRWARGADCPGGGARLSAGAEQTKLGDIVAGDLGHGRAGRCADTKPAEIGFMKERDRLRRRHVIQDDNRPVDGLRIGIGFAVGPGIRRHKALRAGPDARHAVARHGADMNIGEIDVIGPRHFGPVTHARPCHCLALRIVAKGHAHRLDAFRHRQKPAHIVVGNDNRHG